MNPIGKPGRALKGECGSVKVTAAKDGTRTVYIGGEKSLEVSKFVAEEVISALSTSLRPYAGYSIFEVIMLDLDAIIDRMMAGEEAEDGRDPGRGEAYTRCLATIRNPYQPDYPGEKARQMERYYDRNGESE